MRLHLDVFVRAVVSSLFTTDPNCDFPETFYLDQDRLRVLKSEIDDLIYFEICYDMFGQLLRDFGFNKPIPQEARHVLRGILLAIISEGAIGHGTSQWMMNSEHLSVELVRQALTLSRCPPLYNFDIFQRSNQRLRAMFHNRLLYYSSTLESCILPQILASVTRHMHSPPVELYNNLITIPTPPPPPHAGTSHSFPIATNTTTPVFSATNNTLSLSPHPEQFSDISNRVTHIILLHWRVWGNIAYVLEDHSPSHTSITTSSSSTDMEDEKGSTMPPSPAPLPHAPPPPPPPPPSSAVEGNVVGVMKTGEPPDPAETLGFAGRSVP